MSTKMSHDLNVSRPSSRVSRPPGGGSSISFGDSETKPISLSSVKLEIIENECEKQVVETAPKKSVSGKVGIVIAGSIESDFLRDNIVKALAVEGITGCVVKVVNEVAVLPYAAQTMIGQCDVIVAAAFMANDLTGTSTLMIHSSLMQLGMVGTTPIIPALVHQDSLLEAKAVLPTLSTTWAKSACTILGLSAIEAAPAVEAVIEQKPVLTPTVTSTEVLLSILKESLKQRGASGIIGIGRKFRIADDDNSGAVDLAEFTKVVREHAFDWSAVQIKALFDHFDRDRSGCISFDEFVQGLRGELNDRRKQLVLMAFEILDADKSGVIELNDIQAKYDASKHPDVITGRRTKDEILREFLDTFDSDDKDGKVTPAEFCQYYGNVSSSIDDDDYFELMIRNAWHISGGEGWCANSSCRRVLVTHKDGRQTVEEIKNDLGIDANDLEAMTAKLVEQGITDIESIELAGGKKSAITVEVTTSATAKNSVAAGTKPVVGEQSSRPGTAISKLNPRRQPGGASTFTLG